MKVADRTGSTEKLLAVADWRPSPLLSDEKRLASEHPEAPSEPPPTVG
ncbi:carboxymuconolactone decarboxylase family protein [Escherichia coli]|nr:carboxymuconolactone decarboxylase family protein [Escherichia coli]